LDVMSSQALPMDWIFQPTWFAELVADLTARLLDRRQAPRRMIANLAANYLDGTAVGSHVVKDISTKGAFIFADFQWPPGTIMTLTLELKCPDPPPPASVVLWTKVMRCTEDGLGVQFVFLSKGEKLSFTDFWKGIPAFGAGTN